MVNKNDLRFVKTEKLIEDTYICLKKKTDKPIKVSDLCKEALINKSTFYSHFETMDMLHDSICKKEIKKILNDCPNVNEVFINTSFFVESIVKSIKENSKIIKTLFGNDSVKQINAFEEGLLKYYLHGNESPEMKTKIVFAIGGASRLLIANQSQENIQITISLIKKILL